MRTKNNKTTDIVLLISLFISLFLIILLVAIIPNKSKAASNDVKFYIETSDKRRTMYGIYKAIEAHPHAWLNLNVDYNQSKKDGELIKWAGEGDVTEPNHDFDFTKATYSMCTGHQNDPSIPQANNNNWKYVYVININLSHNDQNAKNSHCWCKDCIKSTTAKNEAILLAKLINGAVNSTDQTTINNYRQGIDHFISKNITDFISDTKKTQHKDPGTPSDYSKWEQEANAIYNTTLETTTTSATNLKIIKRTKDNKKYTFLGPYDLKSIGKNTNFSVTLEMLDGSTTKADYYLEKKSGGIREISNLKDNDIDKSTVYIGIQKDTDFSNVKDIKIKKEFASYKARLVMCYAYAHGDQTIGLFSGDPFTDSIEITLPVLEQKESGKLTLTKQDTNDATKKLGNVGFTIQYQDGKYVGLDASSNATYNDAAQTLTTNSSGTIIINNMLLGNYTINEISNANIGYENNVNNGAVTKGIVAGDNTITVNNTKQGKIKVEKVDADNQSKAISGAVFDLYNSAKTAKIGTYTTGSDGTFTTGYLSQGTYYIKEASVPDPYELPNPNNFVQINLNYANINNSEATVKYTATNKMRGKIKVIKEDADNTSKVISGAVFDLYNSTKTAKIGTYTTGSDGTFTTGYLSQGTYYLKEVSVPEPYELPDPNDFAEVNLTYANINNPEFTVTCIKKNKRKAKIKVVKIDRSTSEPIKGAKFTLYKSDKTTKVGTYTTKADGTFTTEYLSQGTYWLKEIYVPYPYDLPTPNDLKEIKLVSNNIENDILQKTVRNTRKYINISGQVWEDIAWVEGKEEKANSYFKEPNTGDQNDQGLEGILVKIIDSKGRVVQGKRTDEKGVYKFDYIEIDKLSEYYIEFEYNGMCYESVRTEIDSFTNRIERKNKIYRVGKTTASKAAEEGKEEKNRTRFNANYAIIAKEQAQNAQGLKTVNLIYDTETEKGKSKLLYRKDKSDKALIWGYEENKKSGKPVSGVDSQYMIRATTKNAYQNKSEKNSGYLVDIISKAEIREKGITEIADINLGIRKRQEVDLAVVKDIDSAKVHINGEDHIYKYADRFNTKLYYDENGNNGYNMSPAVKFGKESKYGAMTYTRALYASDIKYGSNGSTGTDKLDVKITYKIGISNSSNLQVVVNGITDYYDTKYGQKITVGTEKNADGTAKENLNATPQDRIGTYNKVSIETQNFMINPFEEKYIYITLTVLPERIVDILDRNTTVELDNITEINSYSVKRGNMPYAAIDVDSQPDNIEIGKLETYEDDTDKAPGMRLVLQEERKVSGKVFVDESTVTDNIRQGDGIYKVGEKGLSNAKVKLLDKDGQLVQLWHNGKWVTNLLENGEQYTTTTDANGEYTIGGFVPGEYKVVYTWGDKDHKVQDYKATIVDKKSYEDKGKKENGTVLDLEWYKDEFKKKYPNVEWDSRTNTEIRRSDAIDDYTTRKNIDNQSKLMTNANKKVIENYSGEITLENGTTTPLITTMDSTTPIFKANLEYYGSETQSGDEYVTNSDGSIKMNGIYAVKKEGRKNDLKNIDFGIVERAKQQLELDKEIHNVKVTLANGNVLIDATIEGDNLLNSVNNTVFLARTAAANSILKLEIDNEILESSQLDIEYSFKVTNTSELDYIDEDFYKYGKGYVKDPNTLVTLDAQNVIDYLDNGVSFNKNDMGEILQAQNDKYKLRANGLLDTGDKMKKLLDQTTRVLITGNLAGELKPTNGNNTKNMTLKVSKILSNNSDEEIAIENNAEIIKIVKSGGSTITTTPGNYIPSISEHEVDDSMASSVTIVSPTGKNLNYTPAILLAISSLGILAGGIILIKKYIKKRSV